MLWSELGTDRIGLFAAGPDLAGFCRTGTGGFRVKYKAAGTCRKVFLKTTFFQDSCYPVHYYY